MSATPWPLSVVFVVGVCCLFGGGFFSGTETGVMSVSRARVRRLRNAHPGSRTAALVERMLDQIEDTILTCLIGTNLFNVVFSALVTVAVTTRLGPESEWLAVILVSVLVILFAEILPKILYREFPERLMLVSVLPLAAAKVILWPVRMILALYSAAWRRVLPPSRDHGGFDRRSLAALLLSYAVPGGHEERFSQLVDRFLKLAGLDLTAIMQPLENLVTITRATTVSECLELAATSGFSRLPLTIDEGGELLGYVSIRDLLFLPREDHALPVMHELRHEFLLVDERMSPYELFEELRSQGTQLAVVTSPQGRSLGLVTLEDLMETVVGSINDEFDPVDHVDPEFSEKTGLRRSHEQ